MAVSVILALLAPKSKSNRGKIAEKIIVALIVINIVEFGVYLKLRNDSSVDGFRIANAGDNRPCASWWKS